MFDSRKSLLPALLLSLTGLFSNPCFADDTGKVEALIAQEISQQIQTLKKPVTVFNYVAASSVRSYSRDLKNAGLQYLKDSADSFWVLEQERNNNSMLGDGLYTALDPLVSQQYGGKNFALLAIQLPIGVRVLHLNDAWKNPSIESALQEAGCGVLAQFAMLMQSRDYVCHEIALNVLNKLKSSFDTILYPWYAAQLPHCQRGKEALLIANSALITPQNIQAYTSAKTTDQNPSNQAAMEALFRTPGIDTQSQPYHSLWPSLKIGPEVNLSSWIKSNLWGCQ